MSESTKARVRALAARVIALPPSAREWVIGEIDRAIANPSGKQGRIEELQREAERLGRDPGRRLN
jgi:hypothetical protein